MVESENKFDTIDIVTDINELIAQTEVTQYFKNNKNSPIELQMTIPKLANNNLTRFEMTMRNQKVISKLIENGKAPKVAITAVSRKILLTAMGVLKNQKPFDPNWAEKTREEYAKNLKVA